MGISGQEIHLTGFEDFSGRRGMFTMTMPEVGDVDVVSDGELFYYRFPEKIRDSLNVDTEWVSADLGSSGASLFGNSPGFDAGQLLRQLATAGDVSEVRADAESGLKPNVPMDVWVDDDAHVRKLTEQIDVKGETVDVTVELSDFGTHQTIRVPEKSTDVSDQLAG